MVVLIFDMDGILSDSVEIMYISVNNALAEIGKPRVSFEHFLGSVNPRDWDETFRNFGVNPEKEGQEFSRWYNHYKKRNIGKLIPPEKIFPFLQRKGVLYLLSAASKEEVDAFIEGYGLLTYFSEIYYGMHRKTDALVEIVNHHETDTVYFFGDSLSDALCTHDARQILGGKGSALRFIALLQSVIEPGRKRKQHSSSKKDFEKVIRKDQGDMILPRLTDIFSGKGIEELRKR